MTDRPILFSGDMVRAILDGRKTQTRRVCSVQRRLRGGGPSDMWVYGPPDSVQWIRCPYGKPGDRLYVRETWALTCDGGWAVSPSTLTYRAGGDPSIRIIKPDQFSPIGEIEQRPDAEVPGRWRPSIHMPRWACRIALEVVSVRVERLQDISRSDELAEGVKTTRSTRTGVVYAKESFADLWNSINEKRGHGWDSNPWVWVVEFEVANDD